MIDSQRRIIKNTFFSRHSTGVTFILLIIISIVMLTFSQRPVTGTSNQISRVVFSSVQSMFSGIGGMIKNTWNSVSELRKVRKELIAAQDRLADLEKFSSDNEELRLQNIQ